MSSASCISTSSADFIAGLSPLLPGTGMNCIVDLMSEMPPLILGKKRLAIIMSFNGYILICTCPSSVVPIACLYCFIICAIVKVYCCNPPQRALIRNQYRIYVQNMVFIVIIIISTLVVSYPITNVSHQAPYGACLQVQWCLAQLCPIACKLVVVISLHGLVLNILFSKCISIKW